MVEVYKSFHIYDEDVTLKFPIKQTTTRGHNYKIVGKTSRRTHPRHHSFHQRIVNPWNSSPATVVNRPTPNTFKNRLDEHWSGLALKFDRTARDFDPCW